MWAPRKKKMFAKGGHKEKNNAWGGHEEHIPKLKVGTTERIRKQETEEGELGS
jgi:hypothetical protein